MNANSRDTWTHKEQRTMCRPGNLARACLACMTMATLILCAGCISQKQGQTVLLFATVDNKASVQPADTADRPPVAVPKSTARLFYTSQGNTCLIDEEGARLRVLSGRAEPGDLAAGRISS